MNYIPDAIAAAAPRTVSPRLSAGGSNEQVAECVFTERRGEARPGEGRGLGKATCGTGPPRLTHTYTQSFTALQQIRPIISTHSACTLSQWLTFKTRFITLSSAVSGANFIPLFPRTNKAVKGKVVRINNLSKGLRFQRFVGNNPRL